jgi:hypothetical protein
MLNATNMPNVNSNVDMLEMYQNYFLMAGVVVVAVVCLAVASWCCRRKQLVEPPLVQPAVVQPTVVEPPVVEPPVGEPSVPKRSIVTRSKSSVKNKSSGVQPSIAKLFNIPSHMITLPTCPPQSMCTIYGKPIVNSTTYTSIADPIYDLPIILPHNGYFPKPISSSSDQDDSDPYSVSESDAHTFVFRLPTVSGFKR